MSTRLVAYKYFLHVPVIKDVLGQTYTYIRAFSSKASIPVARQCYNKHNLILHICPTVPQDFPASHHKIYIPQLPPCSHILAFQTSFLVPHNLPASHQRSQVRKPENLTEKAVRGMNTTAEERNPKRPREGSSTLSPPPKKTQHCKLSSSPASDRSCVDELVSLEATPCCQPHPGTAINTETCFGDVLKSEGRAFKEEPTPEEETTNESYPEGATADKFTLEGRTKVEFTYKGETAELELLSERAIKKELTQGETANKFTPEEGTSIDSIPEEEVVKEVAPYGETDMDRIHEVKMDKEFTLKERASTTESMSPQTNHDPHMTTSAPSVETTADALAKSHKTTVLGSTQPSVPSEPILDLVEPIRSAKGLLEDAKGMKGTGQKREKKYLGRKSKKLKHSGDKAAMRPNYFVGIQISNPEIHQGLLKVQEDLVAWDESLMRALVDVATSHLTLLVAYLDSEESIAVASTALEESARRLRDGVSDCPLRLTFTGTGNFTNQVVFACLVEDDQHQRLLDMAECVRQVFVEHDVCMPNTKDLHPHLTIAKLSKAPRTKGKHPVVRKIDPSCYSQHLDLHFGTQTVAGLQLLSMNKAKDSLRYYHSDKQVLFDIKLEEEKDHSSCCFPRRPILPITPQRTYSTTAPPEENESGLGNWVLPVAGVVTLVAGAVILGFALSRLRSNQ